MNYKILTKICSNCKESFSTHYDAQTYCSRECKEKADVDQDVGEKSVKGFDWFYNNLTVGVSKSVREEFKTECAITWYSVWSRINKSNIKYRSIKYSVPIFIYLFFKAKSIPIQKSIIKEFCDLTEKEFRRGMITLIPLYPEYSNRDKKLYVTHQVEKFSSLVDLGSCDPYFNEKVVYIMEKLWNFLKVLTEGIITGTVVLLGIIHMNIPSYKFYDFCKSANIRPGGVYCALNRIMSDRLKIGTFNGFQKSIELVRDFLNRYVGNESEVQNSVRIKSFPIKA